MNDHECMISLILIHQSENTVPVPAFNPLFRNIHFISFRHRNLSRLSIQTHVNTCFMYCVGVFNEHVFEASNHNTCINDDGAWLKDPAQVDALDGGVWHSLQGPNAEQGSDTGGRGQGVPLHQERYLSLPARKSERFVMTKPMSTLTEPIKISCSVA